MGLGIKRRGCGRSGRNDDTYIQEKILLPGRCAGTEQPGGLTRQILESVRAIGRDVGSFTGAQYGLHAAEGHFDFAFEHAKRLFEIVAMGRGATTRRNQHVDQAIPSVGVLAREQKRVGIAHDSNVRQGLVLVRARNGKLPLRVVGRQGQWWLRIHEVQVLDIYTPGLGPAAPMGVRTMPLP